MPPKSAKYVPEEYPEQKLERLVSIFYRTRPTKSGFDEHRKIIEELRKEIWAKTGDYDYGAGIGEDATVETRLKFLDYIEKWFDPFMENVDSDEV